MFPNMLFQEAFQRARRQGRKLIRGPLKAGFAFSMGSRIYNTYFESCRRHDAVDSRTRERAWSGSSFENAKLPHLHLQLLGAQRQQRPFGKDAFNDSLYSRKGIYWKDSSLSLLRI